MNVRDDCRTWVSMIDPTTGLMVDKEFTAALTGFSYRHGRQDLNQVVFDYSVSLTFVRQEVETLLAGYGAQYDLNLFCSLGNRMRFLYSPTTAKDAETYTMITDVSRDRNTITITGVDFFSFRSAALRERTFGGFIGTIPNDSTLFDSIVGADPSLLGSIGFINAATMGTYPTAIITGQTYSSVPAFISTFLNWAPTTYAMFGTTTASYEFSSSQDYAYLRDRPNTVPAAVHTFTDDEILDILQYSRNVSDIATAVTISDPVSRWEYTIEDSNGVSQVGYRDITLSPYIDYNAGKRLAGATLAASSIKGSPLVTITTSTNLTGKTFFYPGAVVDVSNVTSPEFDGVSKVYVENVEANLEGSDFVFRLTVSDSNYSSMPQTYAQVPGTRTWAQVPAALTWADALISNIT